MKADRTGASAGGNYEPERLVDYEVYDRNNNSIGDISAIWLRENDEPEYIGVQTTWLVGKHHVVPTRGAQVNHQDKIVRVPYSIDDVKGAPTHEAGSDLELEEEREILYLRRIMPSHRAAASRRKEASAKKRARAGRMSRCLCMKSRCGSGSGKWRQAG